jgi:hypothetical protein
MFQWLKKFLEPKIYEYQVLKPHTRYMEEQLVMFEPMGGPIILLADHTTKQLVRNGFLKRGRRIK